MPRKTLRGALTVLAAIAPAVLPRAASAEVVVTGRPDAVSLEAREASVEEVLSALKRSFGVQYRIKIPSPRRVNGTYSGSLDRVVHRVLEGHDFVLKTGPEGLDVLVTGAVGAAPVGAPPGMTVRAVPGEPVASAPPPPQASPMPPPQAVPGQTLQPPGTTRPRRRR